MNTTIQRLPFSGVLTKPDELVEYVQAIADFSEGIDRRSEPRYAIATAVSATPVDSQGKLSGASLAGVTRDISNSGISVLFTENVPTGCLLLELSGLDGAAIRVVLEVLRQRSVGPFWEVAGRFSEQSRQ